MARANSLRARVEEAVSTSPDAVFLTSELAQLGDYDQVRRAIRQLVKEGKLAQLGYGVYGRTRQGMVQGTRILDANDLLSAATVALDKLGIAWSPSRATIAYRTGKSLQIPAKPTVAVKRRISRNLTYKKATLRYERA